LLEETTASLAEPYRPVGSTNHEEAAGEIGKECDDLVHENIHNCIIYFHISKYQIGCCTQTVKYFDNP
jgi:hypothetical protein